MTTQNWLLAKTANITATAAESATSGTHTQIQMATATGGESMVRMIDADALMEELMHEGLGFQYYKVANAPTVDAVPVIRCKDCKHYYEREWIVGGGSYTTCWYQTIANAQPNDFCSRAERKEE